MLTVRTISILLAPRASFLLLMLGLWASASILRSEDLLFKRHVINDQTDYSAAALIDVNHDGLLDIVCGGDWYEAPSWKQHFVAEIPRISGRPDGFSHLEFDVNRDGWVDVITVNYRSRSIKWMEHPGPKLGPWTVHVAVEPGPMETGRLVDIDGDGQLDLLPNGANFAAWWEFRWNSEQQVGEPAWIRHDLPDEAGGHGLGFGDINGDGRGDIVGQNGWLEAPEDVRHGSWLWHPDYRIECGSIPMLVVDPDEDGDNDIVWCSADGFGVYWLEQVIAPDGQRTWTRHAIDSSWSQGHSPLWADMDGNGQKELITGKRYMAHGGADPGEYDPIAAYRYEYDKTTGGWRRWTLSPVGDRVGMGLDPKVADMDGDGDLDLLTSGRSGLYWLENLGPGDSAMLEPPVPNYPENDLLTVKDETGSPRMVDDPESWGLRRYHIVRTIERVHHIDIDPAARLPLDIQIQTRAESAGVVRQELNYRVDAENRVRATQWMPQESTAGSMKGMLLVFEPEQMDLAAMLAEELAGRGFVCLVPDWSGVADSELKDQLWHATRALDALQSCSMVHGEQLGCLGNALDGWLPVYLAALDQRILACVADGSRARSNPVYDARQDYRLSELLAAVAPRSLDVLLSDQEHLAAECQQASRQARLVYELRRVPDKLQLGGQSLQSRSDREEIYAWLDSQFRSPRFGPRSSGTQGLGNRSAPSR